MLESRTLLAIFHPVAGVSDGATESLRAAVLTANSNREDDTIILKAGIYDLSLANNGAQENEAALGDLDLTEANRTITIQGQGSGTTTIDAHQLDRVFQVLADVIFVLRDVAVINGKAQDDGSSGAAPGSTVFAGGGGILSEAGSRLTLVRASLTQNSSLGALGGRRTLGGGIYSLGDVSIDQCLIDNNRAVAGGSGNVGRNAAGGGIYIETGGSLTVVNSTLSNNEASGGVASDNINGGDGGAAQGGAVFSVEPITLSGTRLVDNLAAGGAGRRTHSGGVAQGGGLFVQKNATLRNAFVAGNRAMGGSGGIGGSSSHGADGGTGAIAQGGGLFLAFGRSLEVWNSVFTLNQASGGQGGPGGSSTGFGSGGDGGAAGTAEGGALFLTGPAVLSGSSLVDNQANGGKGGSGSFRGVIAGDGGHGGLGRGGAVALSARTTTIVSTTVSANHGSGGGGGDGGATGQSGTSWGGGVYLPVDSTVNANNATIAFNVAQIGGGIYDAGTVNAISTIVGKNSAEEAGADYFGTFDTADHVLLENSGGATGIADGTNGNIVGKDPQLGPLANNGGPTQTHLLLPNSPAINVGTNPLALSTDQRGFVRVVNKIDIGAVEFQAPRVALGGTGTFVENAVSLVLAPGASVTDMDNPTFENGDLTVTITVNANGNDRLQIKNQGVGPGQIGVSGTNVSFGGNLIGTFSGGRGNSPLVVTFTTAANAVNTQALVRAITFRTVTEAPSTAARTITFVVSDGDGFSSNPATATKTVNVKAVNDAPKLSLSGSIGYLRDKPAITLAPFATVTDVDSLLDFAGGRLRVRITDGASSSNRLAIGSGFTVDANNNVLKGTTIIGKRTYNGFGTKELIVVFNVNATPVVVQQLVRAITFKTVGGAAGKRTVLFSVSDGDGGISAEATKTVSVS